MNINYENLIVYHCKNDHNYSLDFIKMITNKVNNDDILIIATMYNNTKVVEYALTLKLSTSIKDKIFIKSCNTNKMEIVKLYNEHNKFKYRYTINNNQINGDINIIAKIKDMAFNNECCICLEEANCKTSCNHELCVQCFKKSYNTNGSCPMCRKDIDFCYIKEKFEL